MATFLGVLVRGAEGPGRSKGIDQGSALSPLGLNAALHANHDVPLFHERGRPGFRYADNFAYPSRSLTEGNEVLDEAAALLANANLAFKGGDARHLVDLGRGDEVPLLGLILRKDGDAIAYRVDEKAWDRLGEHLRDAHHNEDPPGTTRAVVGSWITSLGPALVNWTDADTGRVADLVDGLGLEHHEPVDWYRGVVNNALAGWGLERDKALGTVTKA